jgi:hypothetical protein
MTVADELSRRLMLWEQVSAGDTKNSDPSRLRSARIYGGAQGIWVDKATTGPVSPDGHGVAVSILHTGRHYPDDLSEDGVIYHYPTTNRPSGRDAAEVQATKNARVLSLPLFVILPGIDSAAKRSVRLGWVVDFDDENKQFLILFGEDKPEYQSAASQETPFALTGGSAPRKTTAKVRPNQQRFRFALSRSKQILGVPRLPLVSPAEISAGAIKRKSRSARRYIAGVHSYCLEGTKNCSMAPCVCRSSPATLSKGRSITVSC